ncbi:MAG: M48 family metallopeptidase [Bacteriovoracaceae bacterium]|nr:M48 family metallopeptidase [Bacteriovoracaceae bacterium]
MTEGLFYLFIVLATIQLIVKIVLNYVNLNYVRKRQDSVPAEFSDKIDLESHKKAANYTVAKMKFNSVSTAWHYVLLMFWIAFGGLNMLDQWARSFGVETTPTAFIFVAALALISMLLGLPEAIYHTFVLEEKFGFNKTTPALFVKDKIKELIVSAVIGLPFFYALMKIMEGLGSSWWFFAASFMLGFQFIMLWAYPRFIAPLFNKFSKLEDDSLVQEIEKLSKRIDLNFKDYYVMNASIRSSHGNAYFTGFGKNKRIVFFDTLLKSLAPQEIISVLAHELGHLKRKHILKSMAIMSVFLFVGFYILGLSYDSEVFYSAHKVQNPSSYMALVLFMYLVPVYTFPMTPISAWFSRKNEYEADEFAVKNASGQELISALVKMYKDNSSSLTPSPVYSKFYFSHPPAAERVKFIKSQI